MNMGKVVTHSIAVLGLLAGGCLSEDPATGTPLKRNLDAFKSTKGSAAFKIDFVVEEKVFEDDYTKAMNRGSKPETIRREVGTGVQDLTDMGVFTVNPPKKYNGVQLWYPDFAYDLPAAGDKYLHVSFMLYGIGEEKGKGQYDCSARFSLAPKEEFVKSKSDPYSSCPNLNIFIHYDGVTDSLKITLREKAVAADGFGEKVLYEGAVSDKKFPIRFELFANAEKYALAIGAPMQKIAGSQAGSCAAFGKAAAGKPLASGIRMVSHTEGSPARMVVDNYIVDYAKVSNTGEAEAREPERFVVSEHPEWKMVWNDEFDGDKIDEEKWTITEGSPSPYGKDDINKKSQRDHMYLDGKGNAVIKFSYDKERKLMISSGIWSKPEWRYGYFESRLKLTKAPGWWGSYWLMKKGYNPFLEGIEFDILEDFHKKGKPKDQIQHAIHTNIGGSIRKTYAKDVDVKNWDDYHVYGLRWTPTEAVMYVDGIETGRWDFMDFVTTKPCNVIFSGCIGSVKSTYTGIFDENQPMTTDYEVIDYARVYKIDEGGNKAPETNVTASGTLNKKLGESIEIMAEAKPQRGANIEELWLFDNGYPLEKSEKTPHTFKVTFDDAYYSTKPYSTVKPTIGGVTGLEGTHAFSVFAMDSNGLVGVAEKPLVCQVYPKDFDFNKKSSPYKGVAQKLPGRLMLPNFDEGGKGVAYWDVDDKNNFAKTDADFRAAEGVDCQEKAIGYTKNREWTKYTVDIEKEGEYELTAGIASDLPGSEPRGIAVSLDDKPLCEIFLGPQSTGGWSSYKELSQKGVRLPAGRHVLTVTLIEGSINLNYIDFKLEKEAGK